MKNIDPKTNQSLKDDFDQILDAALAKYASAEPRAGLEQRIRAHLSANPRRAAQHGWLQWGLAGSVAVIAVVAILAWSPGRVSHPVITSHRPSTIPRPATREVKPAPDTTSEIAYQKHTSIRMAVVRIASASTTVAHPKLDQFPSPQPLTTEEVALAEYAKNFPKEAGLVAQAQEEFALDAEKEMNDVLETRLSASTEHER